MPNVPVNEIPGIGQWMRERKAEVLWTVESPTGSTIAAIEVQGVKFLIEFTGQQWDAYMPASHPEEQEPLVSMDQCLPTMA